MWCDVMVGAFKFGIHRSVHGMPTLRAMTKKTLPGPIRRAGKVTRRLVWGRNSLVPVMRRRKKRRRERR